MELKIIPNADPSILNIEELTWDKARKEVKAVNKKLFELIETLDPGKELTFIKARYPYGGTVVDNGITHLPLKSGYSVPINSTSVSQALKNKFSYSPIPLGLLLNKTTEVFVKVNEHVIPLRLLNPGKLFGLFETVNFLCGIESEPIWSISSGGRSIFMLSKISNKAGYERIKKELNLYLLPPKYLNDHWDIFRKLSNHESYINEWYNDVLFFTDKWFSKNYKTEEWSNFYNYLFKETNLQSQSIRDERVLNITWQSFSLAIERRNLRPRPYLVDTAKHLMAIALGIVPGFRPNNQTQTIAPIKLLQEVFTEIYGLEKYLPTIMHLHHMQNDVEPTLAYYSLSNPFFPEGMPLYKAYPDIIADLQSVKILTDTVNEAIEKDHVPILEVHSILRRTNYNYFHNAKHNFNEIKSIEALIKDDPAFVHDKKLFKNTDVCTSAPFLSGCIRVGYNSE